MSENSTDWAAQQKAALVLDIINGTTTVASAAAQHGLQATQVQTWVDAGLQGLHHALTHTGSHTSSTPAAAKPRQPHGDLRDLIKHLYAEHSTITIAAHDPISIAWQRMRQYDISQLPVMDGEHLTGILDESDVLLHVYGDEARFADPVAAAMTSRLDQVSVHAPVEALLPVFDRGHVAIVMDGAQFLGLITRIDLLNHLRKRV